MGIAPIPTESASDVPSAKGATDDTIAYDPQREELIRLRAYAIWVEEGQPEGREIEHWRRARAEFDNV